MDKSAKPEVLAKRIAQRSTCQVQVGAVIQSENRIRSWGWNHAGDGMGCHAEMMALQRANPKRLEGARIIVYGQRRKHKQIVLSRPCNICRAILKSAGIIDMRYRNKKGEWMVEFL